MRRVPLVARSLAALALLFAVVVPPGAAQSLSEGVAPDPVLADPPDEEAATSVLVASPASIGYAPFEASSPAVPEGLSPAEAPSGMDEAIVVWGVWMLAFGGFLVYQIAKGPDFDDDDLTTDGVTLSVSR